MGSPTLLFVLAACVLAARAAIPQFAIGPTSSSVRLVPSDSWSDSLSWLIYCRRTAPDEIYTFHQLAHRENSLAELGSFLIIPTKE